MMRRLSLAAATFPLLALTAGCVPSPKEGYTSDELRQVDRLVEVMRVLYLETKPIWPLEKKESLSDLDWAVLSRKAERVEAAATALVEKIGPKRSAGFLKRAQEIREQATGLLKARLAKNEADARRGVKEIGDTCSACHKENR
jgi:hypothetical protein